MEARVRWFWCVVGGYRQLGFVRGVIVVGAFCFFLSLTHVFVFCLFFFIQVVWFFLTYMYMYYSEHFSMS